MANLSKSQRETLALVATGAILVSERNEAMPEWAHGLLDYEETGTQPWPLRMIVTEAGFAALAASTAPVAPAAAALSASEGAG